MIREGMEDFEYLNMLTKYSTCKDPTTLVTESCAQYAASVATTVFPDMYTTNGSPDTLMSKRAEMALVLEQLVAANGQH